MNSSSHLRPHAARHVWLRLGRLALCVVLLAALVAGIAMLNNALAGSAPGSPADLLRSTMQRAQQAGSYQITLDIQQSVQAESSNPLAAGLPRSESAHFVIDGAINGAQHARLSVKPFGASSGFQLAETTPQELLISAGDIYLQVGDRWEKQTLAALPGINTDALSLLAIAHDVRQIEPLERLAGRFERVAFTLPTQAVARYLLAQQGQLDERSLQAASANGFGFGGTGELWIDAAGLPARLVLNLELARSGEDGYNTFVASTSDYTQFGAKFKAEMFDPSISPLTQVSTSPIPGSGLTLEQLSQHMVSWAALLVVLGVSWVLASVPKSRRLQRTKMTTISLILVVALVSPGVVGATSLFDDDPPPTEQGQLTNLLQETRTIADRNRFSLDASDAASLLDNADDDQDGLPNGYELRLGTNPFIADSDLDGLTDYQEVVGFPCYDGISTTSKTVETNPLQPDSNSDGLRDGDEFYKGECRFTGGFSAGRKPYAWNDDNDDDGVPDGLDLSPFSHSAKLGGVGVNYADPNYVSRKNVYYSDPGANLNFESIDADPSAATQPYPFYVDLQLRPYNGDLLRAAYKTALEWPKDLEGSIRNNGEGGDAIFASLFAGVDLRSSGKLQIVPFLQATVRGKDLPSQQVRAQYGIGVSLVNSFCLGVGGIDNCSYNMTVPLVPVERGGQVVALQAKILHDFAGGHTQLLRQWKDVRLKWAVQGDVVRPNEAGQYRPSSNNNYGLMIYDTPYQVTGLQVSRQGGVEMFVAGAQPSGSPDRFDDGPIAMLRAGMEARFLSGGLSLSDIGTRFTNSNTPIEQRWGITNTYGIAYGPSFRYAHLDAALATTAMTTTRQLLNTIYPTHNLTPTLIIASEQRTSTTNLDELGLGFGADAYNNVTINTCAKPLVTTRSLKLQTYRYDALALSHYAPSVEASFIESSELSDALLPISYSETRGSVPEATPPILPLGDWVPLTLDEVLAKVEREFGQAFPEIQQTFDESQATYETVEQLYQESLNILKLATTAWHMGQTAVQSLGDLDIQNLDIDDARVLARFLEDNNVLPSNYADAVYFLLDVYDAGGPHVWLEQQFSQLISFAEGVADTVGSFIDSAPALSLPSNERELLSWTNTTINVLNFLATVTGLDFLSDVADILTTAIEVYQLVKFLVDAATTIISVAQSSVDVATNTAQAIMNGLLSEVQALASSLSVAGLLLQIGMIWLGLAITLLSNDLPPLVAASLVARAVVETVILVALFVIATAVPYGWVILIVFAIGKALEAIFGVNIEPVSAFLDWLFGITITQYSWLSGDPTIGDVKFEQVDPQGGLIQGNTFRFSITSTVLLGAEYESSLNDSWAGARISAPEKGGQYRLCEPNPDEFQQLLDRYNEYGWVSDITSDETLNFNCVYLDVQADVATIGDVGNYDDHHFVWRVIPVHDTTRTPTEHNQNGYFYTRLSTYAYVNLTPKLPRINTWVPLQVSFAVGTINHVCSPALDVAGECYNYSSYNESPPAFTKVFFDILPNTLEGLLNWDQLYTPNYDNIPDLVPTNTDPDGDGLEGYILKTRLPGGQMFSLPVGPDTKMCGAYTHTQWDYDKDGLSDKFEYAGFVQSLSRLLGQRPGHAIPISSMCFKDTDSDGLDDGRELLLGTTPADADTDNDGLKDGAEVAFWQTTQVIANPGSLSVPWRIPLSSRYPGLPDPAAFPNPRHADLDGDHILDQKEKFNLTSPNAFNLPTEGPITLSIDPQPAQGGGASIAIQSSPWPGGAAGLAPTLIVTLPVQFTNLSTNAELIPHLSQPSQNFGALQAGSGPLVYTWQIPTLWGSRHLSATLTGLPVSTSAPLTITAALSYNHNGVRKVAQNAAPVPVNLGGPATTIDTPAAAAILSSGVISITGSAQDPETVSQVFVCAKASNAACSGAEWQAAGGAAFGAQAWQHAWTPPGNNIYTLRAYAVDAYGVAGPVSTPITVSVDATPPSGATFDKSGTLYLPTSFMSNTLATLQITGRITDTNSGGYVSGAGEALLIIDDGSGPRSAKFDKQPVAQPGQTSSAFTYPLSLASSGFGGALGNATRMYTLTLSASDRAGNVGVISQTLRVLVDDKPPLLNSRVPQVVSATVLSLSGRADDTALVLGRSATPAYTPLMALSSNDTTFTAASTDSKTVIAGDLNGDTIDDVVLIEPAGGSIVPQPFRAGLFFGKPGGFPAALNLNNADVLFVGETAGAASFAPSVAGNLDINGDGVSDLLLGDPRANNNTGAAYVILGRRNAGWTSPFNLVSADWRLTLANVSGFGGSISAAGDVDGDGLSDFLVGAATDNTRIGITYLYLGRERGVAPVRSIFRSPHCSTCFTPAPPNLAGLGDTNGDGLSDFLVAYAGSGAFADAVALVYGRAQADWPAAATPVDLNTFAGALLVAPGIQQTVSPVGDVNADGLRDMLIGDPTSAASRVFVLFGRRGAWPVPPTTFDLVTGANASYAHLPGAVGTPSRVGAGLTPMGDLDADGLADFAFGQPGSGGGPNRSAIVLSANMPLTLDTPVTTADFIISGSANSQRSGEYLSSGDINGDAVRDLLIGSPGDQRAYLVKGRFNTSAVAGIQKVEVGVFGPVTNPALPYTSTLPSSWQVATLTTPGGAITPWRANVPLAGNGDYRVYARATDAAGNLWDQASWYLGNVWRQSAPTAMSGASATLNPATLISKTNVSLTGSVSGAQSMIQALRVFDGYNWTRRAATVGAWSHNSVIPREDRRTLSFRVVARDAFGNTQHVARTLLTDTLVIAPALSPNLPINKWQTNLAPTLVVTWPVVSDASGIASTWATIDTSSDTMPTTAVGANSVSKALSLPGAYYVHVRMRDGAGNSLVTHAGPFLVNRTTTPSSILPDGRLDLAGGEYPNGTLLNYDPYAAVKPAALWGTWDASKLYLGFQGNAWNADDRLTVYLDTRAGGRNSSLAPFGNTHTLPFAADFAFVVGVAGKGMLYSATAGGWTQVNSPASFAAMLADTEIALDRNEIQAAGATPVSVLAFAEDTTGVWAVLPAGARPNTSNILSGTLTFADRLQWPSLANAVLPNAGQRQFIAPNVLFDLGWDTALRVNTTTLMTMTVTNPDVAPYVNVPITVTVGPTQTQQLMQLTGTPTGASCIACPAGGREWVLGVNVAASSVQTITLSPRALTPSATGVYSLPVTARAANSGLPNQPQSPTTAEYVLDQGVATVNMLAASQTVYQVPGPSHMYFHIFNPGTFVRCAAQVEVNTGSGWTPVCRLGDCFQFRGTLPSTAQQDWSVRVRGDNGVVSTIATRKLIADAVAPTAQISATAVLKGGVGLLSGMTQDSFPTTQPPARVEISIDGGRFMPARVSGINPAGGAGLSSIESIGAASSTAKWTFALQLGRADGKTIQVVARATDAAGNVGPNSAPMQVVLDNVGPLLSVTQTEPLLGGTVNDGSGVVLVEVSLDGGAVYQAATLDNGNWSFDPSTWSGGARQSFALVRARDTWGNSTQLAVTLAAASPNTHQVFIPIVIR